VRRGTENPGVAAVGVSHSLTEAQQRVAGVPQHVGYRRRAANHLLVIGEEVRDAVHLVRQRIGGVAGERRRGLRVLINTTIRRSRVLIVLYPTADHDVWNLGSAYPTGSQT
jgi:hypothetical protein